MPSGIVSKKGEELRAGWQTFRFRDPCRLDGFSREGVPCVLAHFTLCSQLARSLHTLDDLYGKEKDDIPTDTMVVRVTLKSSFRKTFLLTVRRFFPRTPPGHRVRSTRYTAVLASKQTNLIRISSKKPTRMVFEKANCVYHLIKNVRPKLKFWQSNTDRRRVYNNNNNNNIISTRTHNMPCI